MPENLRVIAITVSSDAAAEAAIDQLDELTESGDVSIDEIALVYKNAHDKVRVHYVHRHGTAISKHHRDTSKAFLKELGGKIDAGRVGVVIATDAASAETLLDELEEAHPDVTTVDISGAEQTAIADEVITVAAEAS